MIRRAYIRRVEDRLEQLEDDIDRLRERIATPVDEFDEFRDRVDRDLRSKAKTVSEGIRAIETAGASSWGHLKYAVDEGLKELGQAVYEAAERYRKTGSGDR